ncbi:MAG: hypothetical protein KBT45_04145 [Bacteroidales bacterium]|nr:hypothetical protein [Candidatus Colimorpha pelethequi]
MNEAEGTLCRRFQNQIEIDMVALESINHRIRIAETKMQKGKVSIPLPQDKARKIQPHFKHYQVEYVALSLEDL